ELHFVLHRSGCAPEAVQVAAELERTIASGPLPPQAEIMARKSIALQLRAGNSRRAIAELSRACELVESLRVRRPRGEARSQAVSAYRSMHRDLARLLREAGDGRAAF